MSRDTFAARMRLLRAHRVKALQLGDAIERLKSGTLPANSVVITVDDGYKNTPQEFLPVLVKHGYPATVYVTTYYVEKQTPIFRLAVQYMFWKTHAVNLTDALPMWGASLESVDLRDQEQRRRAAWACINYGEQRCTEEQRQDILQDLGEKLGVNYNKICQSGGLTLMSADDIAMLAHTLIDVQLHTHRHRFPNHRQMALQELHDNADYLRPLVHGELVHFCYPSGIWSPEHHPWLAEAGIVSATTCRIGFNDENTNAYSLKRYLDRGDVSEIEFLAEITGFLALLRRIRRIFKGR